MNYIDKTPSIIKETSSGMFTYDIRDDMFQAREVECLGEINAESVNALIRQLRFLARQDPEAEITLYINSPGGEVASGLALLDVMKAVKCPIRTICVGTAASMGAVIFAAGARRQMLPHSRVMIHDPLIDQSIGGSALKLKRMSEDIMRTREVLGGLLAQATGHTVDEIYAKTAEDAWFDAREAVDFGLADEIIHTL